MPISFLSSRHYLIRTRLTREIVRERLSERTWQQRVKAWSSIRTKGYYFSGIINPVDFRIKRAPGERNDGAVYVSGRFGNRIDRAEVELTIGTSRFVRLFVYFFLGLFALIFLLMLFFIILDLLLSGFHVPAIEGLLIPGVILLFSYFTLRYTLNKIRKETLELLMEVWGTQDVTEVVYKNSTLF